MDCEYDSPIELTSGEDTNDTDYKPTKQSKQKRKHKYISRTNLVENTRTDQSIYLVETDSNETPIINPSTSNSPDIDHEENTEPVAKKMTLNQPISTQIDLHLQPVKEIKFNNYELGLKFQFFNNLEEYFKPNERRVVNVKSKNNKENTQTNKQDTKFAFHLGSHQILFEEIDHNSFDDFELTNEASTFLYESRYQNRYFILLFNSNKSILVELKELNEVNKAILYLAANKCLILTKSLCSFNTSERTGYLDLDVYLTDKLRNSNLTDDPSECYKTVYSYYTSLIMTKFYFSLIDVKLSEQIKFYSDEIRDNLTTDEAKLKNENLFDLVYNIHSKEYGDQFQTDLDSNESKFIIEKSNLKPILRPYQVNAVRWMLRRESFSIDKQLKQKHFLQEIDNIEQVIKQDEEDEANLHPLFVKIVNKNSQVIYYHKFLGLFTSQAPLKKQSLPGGILADEMGLGKTLEILACILINPRLSFPQIEPPVSNEKIRKLNEKTFSCLCGQAPASFRFYDNSSSKDASSNQEIYSCILCGAWTHIDCVNYKGEREQFLCLKCCTQVPPISSGCTLIVTPSVISHQWLDEIQKHVNSKLKVLFYTGCNQKFIQPQDLAQLDICITTYDVLSNELSHVFAIENMRQLRKTKRFMNVPSPLTCVEWWRICLDEAQMVHSTNTRCAEMASRLHAVNRWCVTGTPIGRSLADLHGLFTFIREDPFIEKKWFKAILYEPYVKDDRMPLANAVSKVLWRTAKKYVEDQIDIPAQTQKTYWLNFSPFELHLYERVLELFHETRRNNFSHNLNENNEIQIDESSNNVNRYFNRYNKDLRLDELERSVVDHIMMPLLDLRLACNHPQLVLQKRSFMPRGSRKEKLLSMEKSLQLLMKKTETECESFLRSVTFHSNAMAGLHIIKKDFETAKQIYEKILSLESDYNHNIRIDSLQKVHTIFNLIYVLQTKEEDNQERIANLDQQLKELENKYTLAFDSLKVVEENKLTTKINETNESLKDNINEYQEWLLDMLIKIEKSANRSKEFWDRLGSEFHVNYLKATRQAQDEIESDISSAKLNYQIFNKPCTSYADLKQFMVAEFENLIKQRKNLIQKLFQFVNKNNKSGISSQIVKQVADCHLRNKNQTESNEVPTPKCELCKCDHLFREYSRFIFSCSDDAMKITSSKEKNSNDSDDEDYNELQKQYQQQINSTSDLEKLNRIIVSYVRSFDDGSIGKKFNEDLTGLKEEFKLCRQYWISVSNTCNSYDELDMVKTRLRLLQPNEKKKLAHTIEEHSVDIELISNQNDRALNEKDLKKKYGQLIYLKSLIKSNSLGENEENQEPCPICQNNLGYSWFILSCGHSYCSDCHSGLINSENEYMVQIHGANKTRSIRCALCRELSQKKEIYHVCTKNKLLENQKEGEKKEKKLQINDKSYDDYTNNELANIKIKGNCNSAKVEGIVKCLLKILKNDYRAKCLVFSEHVTMLELIQDLLKDNLIDFKLIKDNPTFQKNIKEFKTNPNVNVLLMPYAYGANGLNIIEATHVLLVEPTLNRGQEMQAIGRVHRIGQTKPTSVYRFVMRNTIEELVFNLFDSNDGYSKKPIIDKTQPNCSAALAAAESDEYNQYKMFNERKILRICDLENLFINL